MRCLFVVLFCAFALPLHAYRREYRVTLNGLQKAGSEVCFFRGDNGGPLALYFTYDTVECLSADRILDMPPGLFHVFARHPGGYVSEHPDYFVYRGPPKPEAGYEALEIPMRSAAMLDLHDALAAAPRGASIGLWLAPTPAAGAAFFPAVTGETTMLVPAERLAVPILVVERRPAALGRPLMLAPGERETLQRFVRNTSVVTMLAVDPGTPEQERDVGPPPDVVLVTARERLKPLFPLMEPPGRGSSTLLFFVDVPPGKARIEAGGVFWQRATANIDVVPEALNLERQAIAMKPGGALLASWTSTAHEAAGSACAKPPPGQQAAIELTLERCAADACTKLAQRAAPYESAGSVTFGGLPAGEYRVTVVPPGGRPLRSLATVTVARQTSSVVTIDTFGFFGKVTLNGEPLQARLFFDTGSAQSDADGRYTAALAGDPRTNLIRVQPCGKEQILTFIPRERMNPNAAYDIALRLLVRRVVVTDGEGKPLAESDVWYAPIKAMTAEGSAAFYSSPVKPTDANGSVTFADVPAEENVDVCAKKNGYRRACMRAAQKEETVTVRLARLAQPGKVLNQDGPGMIAAVDPRGRISEMVAVAADGSFGFATVHAPPEYLVYTAPRRPLAVLSIEPSASELTIALPNAPVRSFQVIVPAAKENTWVGLWIGNAYVPLQMLAFHEEPRGLDPEPHPGQPLEIRDVLETAPIFVAAAELPPGAAVADPFIMPQYAGIVRHRVTEPRVTLQP